MKIPSHEDRRVPAEDRDFGRLKAYRDSDDTIYWIRGDTVVYPDMKKIIDVVNEIPLELKKAIDKHRPMHSIHEGYAVILEEVDELWDEVKAQKPDLVALRKEAMQVAAMAIRLVIDVVDKPK